MTCHPLTPKTGTDAEQLNQMSCARHSVDNCIQRVNWKIEHLL